MLKMPGLGVFGYDPLREWGMANGVIEWEGPHIPDGWSHLTEEEKSYYLEDKDDD